MRKTTTITYEESTLHAAEAALGTRGLKATVDAAFEHALRRAAWQRLLDRHRAGAIELTNDDVERLNTPNITNMPPGSHVVSESTPSRSVAPKKPAERLAAPTWPRPDPRKPQLHIGYSRQGGCFYASVWGGRKLIDGCTTLADVEEALRAGRYPEPTISTLALAVAGMDVAKSPYRIRRKSRE